jgi:hypothetical protein
MVNMTDDDPSEIEHIGTTTMPTRGDIDAGEDVVAVSARRWREAVGIVRDLADAKPEEYDSYQGSDGAGLRCALCGEVGWEKDIPTNVPMPIELHATECPYRRALSWAKENPR